MGRRAARWHAHSRTQPRVFVISALVGAISRGLFCLHWCKGKLPALAFLVGLPSLGVKAPTRILFGGKGIATAVDASRLVGWSLSTALSVWY